MQQLRHNLLPGTSCMLHELVLLLLWHAQTDKSCFPAWQQALKTLGKRETDIRAMVYPSVSRVCVCTRAARLRVGACALPRALAAKWSAQVQCLPLNLHPRHGARGTWARADAANTPPHRMCTKSWVPLSTSSTCRPWPRWRETSARQRKTWIVGEGGTAGPLISCAMGHEACGQMMTPPVRACAVILR